MAELTAEELAVLEELLSRLGGRGAELPWPLFRFVTEVSATANVDLLVRDGAGRVLLAWREDPFGRGWHVPGSIIRHREEIAHRIAACAGEEFGRALAVEPEPVALIQIFDDRGHSVSLVHLATLRDGAEAEAAASAGGAAGPGEGDRRWFAELPADMYPSHGVYREVVAALAAGRLSRGIPVFTQHAGERDAGSAPEGMISADASLTDREPRPA